MLVDRLAELFIGRPAVREADHAVVDRGVVLDRYGFVGMMIAVVRVVCFEGHAAMRVRQSVAVWRARVRVRLTRCEWFRHGRRV